MSWKDRLRPASFRGVPFFVETDEAEYGRRQVTHTAALVDVPTLEDLGRAADVFQVDGYLIGEDYDVVLQQLIEAIRDVAGPGRLVHPRYGEKTVGASGFRVRHQNSEGRMCRFVVTFGEAGELSQPVEGVDSINVLASRSDAIQGASSDSFLDKFKAADFPQFVRDAAANTLETVGEYLQAPSSFLSETFSQASEVFGVVTDTVDAVSDVVSSYQREVSSFIGGISGLISVPTSLAGSLVSLVARIRPTYGSGAGAMLSGLVSSLPHIPAGNSSMPSATSSDDPENPETPVLKAVLTPSRAQIATNQEAIVQLVRQTAVAELAVVAASKSYETVEEAVAARDVVADMLDIEAEITMDDVVYQQLVQARTEVVQALPAADQSYSRLVPYSPPMTLPALVIAQTLYGDGSEADQIVSKNSVRHPGFVTGGQTLQVLSDA